MTEQQQVQEQQQTDGKRVLRDPALGRRRRMFLLALCITLMILGALSLAALADRDSGGAPAGDSPPPAPSAVPTPTPTPAEPEPPSAEPTPEVVDAPPDAYDFSLPAEESLPVEDEYFADAVFLGDSRSDGLRLYSSIRGADFLAYKSLMVFQVTGTGGVDRKSVPINGNGVSRTVLEALEAKEYGKVYIMFGVNELGYKDDDAFHEAFVLLVDEIRQRQPDAVIYIQSLIPIHPQKAHVTNPASWLNNEQIAVYNEILRQVAEETHVVFLNVQEAMVDEDGILPAEGTTDGIHFTRAWYETWYQYLKTHTVDKASYDRGALAVEDVDQEETP